MTVVPQENQNNVLKVTFDIMKNLATKLINGKIEFCNKYLKRRYACAFKLSQYDNTIIYTTNCARQKKKFV